jgi:hypothetical protein
MHHLTVLRVQGVWRHRERYVGRPMMEGEARLIGQLSVKKLVVEGVETWRGKRRINIKTNHHNVFIIRLAPLPVGECKAWAVRSTASKNPLFIPTT